MNADVEGSGRSKSDVLARCTFFLEGSGESSSKIIGETFRFEDGPGIGFGLFSITSWIPEGRSAMESNLGSIPSLAERSGSPLARSESSNIRRESS